MTNETDDDLPEIFSATGAFVPLPPAALIGRLERSVRMYREVESCHVELMEVESEISALQIELRETLEEQHALEAKAAKDKPTFLSLVREMIRAG